MTYPNSPGFQSGSETSEAAATATKNKGELRRKKILEHMAGGKGMTIDEAAVLLECETGTASARFSELEAQGKIKKSAEKRKTRSGCSAKVYFLVATQGRLF